MIFGSMQRVKNKMISLRSFLGVLSSHHSVPVSSGRQPIQPFGMHIFAHQPGSSHSRRKDNTHTHVVEYICILHGPSVVLVLAMVARRVRACRPKVGQSLLCLAKKKHNLNRRKYKKKREQVPFPACCCTVTGILKQQQ